MIAGGVLLIASSCRKPAEPITKANYYIQNKTSLTLRIDALQGTAEVPLLKDTINPGLTEKFYTAVEGSGGHIYPSNFFTDFKVFAITNSADSLVYSGVQNNDWNNSFLYHLSSSCSGIDMTGYMGKFFKIIPR
jgi:hypothetical protein